MDASLSTPSLDSAKPPDEVLTLADHLPEALNPKLYTALVKVMHVYELAPDEKTWQPKVRWFLTACTGVRIKVDPKDRGRVIGMASTIIAQHLSSNEEWLGLYLTSVEEAKVQAALDEKAYDKDLAPTPAPKSRPKPPARAPAGHALPYLLTPMPDAGGGMTQMAQPAGADLRTRFAGVGISAVRECDTFGPPAPLRRPADSPPPIKGKSEFRNHKGVLETPALIGEDMTESVKMAGLKDTPQITRTNAKPYNSLPLTLPPRPFRERTFPFAQTGRTASSPSSRSSRSRLSQAPPARAPTPRTSRACTTPSFCASTSPTSRSATSSPHRRSWTSA